MTTVPLSRGEAEVALVIEMALDITPLRRLELHLKQKRQFYQCLVENSATAILALDRFGNVTLLNPAARNLLAWKARQPPSPERL